MLDIKDQFPIFASEPGLAYLDSAATTLKPARVLARMNEYYERYSANVARGLYPLSERATLEYEAARDEAAGFLNAAREEVVFTRGTTEGLNLLAYALEGRLQPGDEIAVSEMEHHSNFLPWQALAERTGATLAIVPFDRKTWVLDPEAVKKHLGPKTKIFAFTAVSNVLGSVNPVRELVAAARAANPDVITVMDAAQAAAHQSLDVRALGCDALVFSGHKAYGPTGIGVLYGKKALLDSLPPFHYGGEMVLEAKAGGSTWKEIPHKFEAGTPPIAEAIGLGEALRFIRGLGWENIRQHEERLAASALRKLEEAFGEAVRILGPDDPTRRSNIVAFTVQDVHPHDLAQALGERGVAIRAGHHCASPLHDCLGLTATTRATFSIYNTEEDIERLVEGIAKARELFTRAA